MEQLSAGEMERTMKMQEVILRVRQITWWLAAEILGVSERTMRRWKPIARTIFVDCSISGMC
jgi:hypothetical protein